MTDDFDFDFDVDRGRSASRTEDREPEEIPERANGSGNGSQRTRAPRSNGSRGNGTVGNGSGADVAPPVDDDWLSLGDDEFSPGSISPLRERDDGPAGPPTPGEGRQFAKDARRRASRRPSPILDLEVERERLERSQAEDEDVDFESMLELQPQKSGVARRGSALRNAFRGGVESLRRVGGERLAESRDRVQALRERVPARVPQPRPAGGDGKPPPPRLPRRISSRRPRKPQPGRIKWLRLAIVAMGIGLLGIVSFFFGMMMAITQDLPQLEAKQEFATAKNSVVLDAQGNKIGDLLNNNGRVLSDSGDISPYMKQATVAIEDRRFYEHNGVDVQGLFRAGFANLMPGGSTQGGSTITEQFVKNALEAQGNRTVFQKFREAALAYQIEREWDKDKILTEYLNSIYFGEGAYGIEAAARTYFGYRHPGCGEEGADPCAKLLTPPEAAMLAGIITSPSAFSPRVNPQAAIDRRNLVLDRMNEDGYIADAEYDEGVHDVSTIPTPSDIEHPKDDSLSPYYTSWLRQQVVDLYGPGRAFGGGLQVHSSLDLEMQEQAQEIAEGTLSGVAPTASAVVIDNETGQVKAMVGGSDYDDHPFNLATNGHRQPGSAFKPFTLATALSQGISSNATYSSNQKVFKVPRSKNEYFEVNNYEDTYYGSSSLAAGTTHSDNSVYAELALGRSIPCVSGCGGSPAVRGGTRAIARTAHEMGLTTKFSKNPSMVLGAIDPGVTPLEMAYAFTTIATRGERLGGNLDSRNVGAPNNVPEDLGPVAIDKITDSKGKTIAEDKVQKERVLSTGVADTMKTILRSNVLAGTGELAQSAPNAWGKTGTTENNGDAWFCGGTDHFTACVWVGHADSTTPMETEYNGGPVDGGTYPAYIWGQVMAAIESIYREQKAEAEAAKDEDDDDSESSSSTASDDSFSYPDSSSSSPSSSGGGDGGNSGEGGGGGGDTSAPAPAPAPSTGGGGGSTGGVSGTGGTGL